MSVRDKKFKMFSSLNHIDNYALHWPVLHIAFVGGLGSALARWREQCRPEAWAVRGLASMPEAPFERGGIATNDSAMCSLGIKSTALSKY